MFIWIWSFFGVKENRTFNNQDNQVRLDLRVFCVSPNQHFLMQGVLLEQRAAGCRPAGCTE